ncbi:MAG: IS3 family transposase [Pseudomonadota bacterium]
MEMFKDKYSPQVLASVLEISLSRVYFLIKQKPKTRRIRRRMKDYDHILKLIRELITQFPHYGYRKMFSILRYRYGMRITRRGVYELMKEHKLLMPCNTRNKRLFRGVPFSYKLEAVESNTLWGIDMTYIWCGNDGWCYLHGVIDHHDKNLLGYTFSRSCKAIGAVMALAEAASKRQIDNLELRSDNGCHYGSRLFRDEIRRMGIKHTRTMVNTPKGNAVIERFFKSLKQECVWQYQFKNFEEAKDAVDKWTHYYNNERPHQTLGYLTPVEFYNQSDCVRKVA